MSVLRAKQRVHSASSLHRKRRPPFSWCLHTIESTPSECSLSTALRRGCRNIYLLAFVESVSLSVPSGALIWYAFPLYPHLLLFYHTLSLRFLVLGGFFVFTLFLLFLLHWLYCSARHSSETNHCFAKLPVVCLHFYGKYTGRFVCPCLRSAFRPMRSEHKRMSHCWLDLARFSSLHAQQHASHEPVCDECARIGALVWMEMWLNWMAAKKEHKTDNDNVWSGVIFAIDCRIFMWTDFWSLAHDATATVALFMLLWKPCKWRLIPCT